VELLLFMLSFKTLVEYRSRAPNLLWFGVVFGGQTMALLLTAIGYRSRCSLSLLGEGFNNVLGTPCSIAQRGSYTASVHPLLSL
jgi:hypothetical protein